MYYIWCYNLRLGSGCNLGKGLSKSGEKSQLVKCKDTELYLQLYVNDITEHKEKIRKQHLLYKALTETTMVWPIIAS